MIHYLPLREELTRRDPENADSRHRLADAWRNDAVIQSQRGNLEAAAEAHRKAWQLSEKQLPDPGVGSTDTPRFRWVEGLRAADEVFAKLARAAQEKADRNNAREHWQTVVEIRGKFANEKLLETQPRQNLAFALIELAQVNFALGERSQARNNIEVALLLLVDENLSIQLPQDQRKLLDELIGVPPQADSSRALIGSLLAQCAEGEIQAALNSTALASDLLGELRRYAAQWSTSRLETK